MPKTALNNKSLVFVDLETTGTNPLSGRIIEIGIIKVFENTVIKEYQTLINPELRIDPFIETMTGIKYSDLENAPVFESVKDEIFEILDDSIFVAHNVRFDYSFVRNEFKRAGISFSSKHFDTIKLARHLYPGHTRYNLDSLMERHNIVNVARHRAFGDAQVLWKFYELSKHNFEDKVFDDALKVVLKKPTLPAGISQNIIDKIPESPGVYTFFGENGSTLYIGKSINLKDRVLSHFANDYGSNTDMKIVQTVKSIEWTETAGELSALLLESALIKRYKPIYNRMLRESRKMLVVVKQTNSKGYNTIEIKELMDVEIDKITNILGVFRSLKQAKERIYEIAKENRLCLKILGLEKGKGYCFNYQLESCLGACVDEEHFLKYNLRFDQAFYAHKVKAWKFDGPVLIKELGEKSEFHLIDKWCHLGSIKNESENLDEIERNYIFDYDTYKILKRYLENPRNLPSIITLHS